MRFLPTSAGLKTATLSLANNTPGSNPLQINLAGTAAADGDPTLSFNPAPFPAAPQASDGVYGSIEQPDGRTVVFGQFSSAGGRTRAGIFRLSTAGAVEAAYDPNVGGRIRAAILQADGKLVIGGEFGSVGGQARANLARLNADGSLDTGFAAGVDAEIYALALQRDGKVIAAGTFTAANGTPRGRVARAGRAGGSRGRVARFHGDGTLDPGFADPACNGLPWGLRVQPDGKVIVMGGFTSIAGTSRVALARLNSDGTLDGAFSPTVSGAPAAALIQPDGKIVLGGLFSSVNGSGSYLARLNADGTLAAAFNAATNNYVYSLALQADGKLLFGRSLHLRRRSDADAHRAAERQRLGRSHLHRRHVVWRGRLGRVWRRADCRRAGESHRLL